MGQNPSLIYPAYNVIIVTKEGVKFEIPMALMDITISEPEKEIASKASISIVNAALPSGARLTGNINEGDKVFIYCNTGDGTKEVFRGTIWVDRYSSQLEKKISLTVYDPLIYLQNSKDVRFYPKGKASKAIVDDICTSWGIPYDYQYRNCTHEMLLFRGNYLSDIIIEVLNDCKKQTGEKYVVRSDAGKAFFLKRGTNSTVYYFGANENVIQTASESSMEKLITKVIVVTNEDKKKKPAVEATVQGDTATYGTLQDVVSRTKTTTLANAKKEADQILKDNGKPSKTYELTAVNIPWLHKGDKVKVEAGDLVGDFFVKSVVHNVSECTMNMEVER